MIRLAAARASRFGSLHSRNGLIQPIHHVCVTSKRKKLIKIVRDPVADRRSEIMRRYLQLRGQDIPETKIVAWIHFDLLRDGSALALSTICADIAALRQTGSL
jgi:hypothetical protein